jgi:hypothetical protein
MGTMQQYLSALLGNENTYSFPYTFHGSSYCATQSEWSSTLFPSRSKTFAKVHDTERFTSPDGLHSDREFVVPAHTLNNCGGTNEKSVPCAEIYTENKAVN